ncbi:uncharacterized protein [Palaemon carinicauda]|uniref:uncharacterized protein n=1 Tax=Palaemon carinicauda TaxID=392227 RepID=UPI0035B5B9AA
MTKVKISTLWKKEEEDASLSITGPADLPEEDLAGSDDKQESDDERAHSNLIHDMGEVEQEEENGGSTSKRPLLDQGRHRPSKDGGHSKTYQFARVGKSHPQGSYVGYAFRDSYCEEEDKGHDPDLYSGYISSLSIRFEDEEGVGYDGGLSVRLGRKDFPLWEQCELDPHLIQ